MWDGMGNHFQSQRHLTLNDETASSKTLRHEDAQGCTLWWYRIECHFHPDASVQIDLKLIVGIEDRNMMRGSFTVPQNYPRGNLHRRGSHGPFMDVLLPVKKMVIFHSFPVIYLPRQPRLCCWRHPGQLGLSPPSVNGIELFLNIGLLSFLITISFPIYIYMYIYIIQRFPEIGVPPNHPL